MCTVTFLPFGEHHFLLTSNRDELTARPTIPPTAYNIHGQKVYMPKDQKAGGTWIATHHQFTLCLLNGAFQSHQRKAHYRQSRGLVILDFYKYLSVSNFVQQYNFEGIEPFTLLIVEHAPTQTLQLTELRWDEHQLHLAHKPIEPQIWSSATLYQAQVIAARQQWFAQWLQQHRNDYSQPNNILHFHQFGGNGDPTNDLSINRYGIMQTVSTTLVSHTHTHYMQYNDRVANKTYCKNLANQTVDTK